MSTTASLAARLRITRGETVTIVGIALFAALVARMAGAALEGAAIMGAGIGITFGLIRLWELAPCGSDEVVRYGPPSIAAYIDQLRARYPPIEAQRRIARELGISLTKFRAWPEGLRPSERTIQGLAFQLGIDVDLIRQAAGRLPLRELQARAAREADLVELLWRLPKLQSSEIAQLTRMAS